MAFISTMVTNPGEIPLYWGFYIGDGGSGTGFFSLIPFPDKTMQLRTLMTNSHILKKRDIVFYVKYLNQNVHIIVLYVIYVY